MANGAILSLGLSGPLSIDDADGKQIASLPGSALGGSGSDMTAAAIDATGNVWIVGVTNSADFPLVHPFYSTVTPGNVSAFVAKLSPDLTVLFSSFLQGSPVEGQTNADAIALDNSGNAYIAGDTTDSNFPTTGPTFGTGTPSPARFTFITEISADGTKMVYSRLLGAIERSCIGGSSCASVSATTTPAAVAVDQAGGVVVAGSTNTLDFPITVTPYPGGQGAFIARIAPGGGQMSWSTEIGSLFLAQYGPQVQSVMVDPSGNVYLAGTALGGVAGTPHSLQPTATRVSGIPDYGFVIKFSPDGAQMLYATNIGGDIGSILAGMTFDSSGNVWLTGSTASAAFSGLPGSGVDFALELNSDASALNQTFDFLPETAASFSILHNGPLSFDSFGRLLLIGDNGNLLRWNPDTAATSSALFGLTNSAVPSSMSGGAAGELATFYGVGLGPSQALVGMPDAAGRYPTTLGGVTVGFSAGIAVIPAPLLYVGPNQINFQVPFGVNGTTPVIVTTPSGQLPALPFQALGSIGIFGVVNPDGSINSASNPAPVGSAVALYATGLGAPEPSSGDGAISARADNAFANSVTVQSTNLSVTLPVLYAGTAPTLINGLDQINVQLPTPRAGFPRTDPVVAIKTASALSNQVIVYTQ
jgi:uncharacterized protein (TIGR03437 family)